MAGGAVRGLARAGEVVAIIALWLLAAVMIFEVVSRYLFDRPTGWSDIAAAQLLPAVALFAAGQTLLAGGHISIDGAVDRLPSTARLALRLFGELVGTVVLAVFVWYSVTMVMASYVRAEMGFAGIYTFPAYIPQIAVPVGLLVMLLAQLLLLVRTSAELARHSRSRAGPLREDAPDGRQG